MDFEEFKKYHNANYHDGDSTFDELNYSRSNGDDFDNEFVQDCFDHFKAGQQSKQAEIDKIKQLLKQWDNWISVSSNHNCIDIVKECADELREFLK